MALTIMHSSCMYSVRNHKIILQLFRDAAKRLDAAQTLYNSRLTIRRIIQDKVFLNDERTIVFASQKNDRKRGKKNKKAFREVRGPGTRVKKLILAFVEDSSRTLLSFNFGNFDLDR